MDQENATVAEFDAMAFNEEGIALRNELAELVDRLVKHGGSNVFVYPLSGGPDPMVFAAGPRSHLLEMLPDVEGLEE